MHLGVLIHTIIFPPLMYYKSVIGFLLFSLLLLISVPEDTVVE
jgi:hypothetical protein